MVSALRALGYAYAWDLIGDPAAAERFAATGIDGVAVAAAYHSARAAAPRHAQHRIVVADHAACYVPVRDDRWRDAALRPVAPSWVDDDDSFGAAAAVAHGTGLDVHAWIVLTHNSRLGAAHRDATVRNAFGEHYEYALCPSSPAVAEYCERLVAEILDQSDVDGVVLESCGPLGVDHGGHHDKLEFAAWTPSQRALLSICFCSACASRFELAGIDSVALAQAVRAGVDSSAVSVETALGEIADAVREVRADVAAGLRESVTSIVRSMRPGVRITVHGSADPWATGAFPTVAPAAGDVDAVVANCWDIAAATTAVQALRSLVGADVAVGGYLRPDTVSGAGLTADELIERLAAAGLDELHLYHLGLVPEAALGVFARLVAAIHTVL